MPAKTKVGPFAGSTTVNETWGFGANTISFESGFEVSRALMDETAAASTRQQMRPRKKFGLEAEALLRKLPKCLESEGLDKAYLLLAQAKTKFELAGDTKRVDDMIALHNRLQGDMLVVVSKQQWESKQWDHCAETMLRAKELYKLYAKSDYRFNLKESGSVNPTVLEEKAKDEERFESVTAVNDKIKILALNDGMAALNTIAQHLGAFDWKAAKELHALALQLFGWFDSHLAKETATEAQKYTRMQAVSHMPQQRLNSSHRPSSSSSLQRPISAAFQKAAAVSARKMSQLPLRLRAVVNSVPDEDGAFVQLQVEAAEAKRDHSQRKTNAWGGVGAGSGTERWRAVEVEQAVAMGVRPGAERHVEMDYAPALAKLDEKIRDQINTGVHARNIQKSIRGLGGRHEAELVQLRLLIDLLEEYADLERSSVIAEKNREPQHGEQAT
jgi:hypothetical protein